MNDQQVDQFASRQCFQFMHVTAQTPPYVPNRDFGRLTQYAAYVSALAATEIQNKAALNPLRTFMFNIAAQNGFRNEYFESVIGGILGGAELLVASGQAGSAEQAVQSMTGAMISLMAAVLTNEYPRLRQYVQDPALIAEIQNNIAQYNSIGQQVQNMRLQVQQQQQTQQVSGGWGAPAQQQQQQTAGFTSWATVSGGNSAQPPQQATWGQGNMGWATVQQTGGGAGQAAAAPVGGIADRYSSISQIDATTSVEAAPNNNSFSSRFAVPDDIETVTPIQENKAMNQMNQVNQSVVANLVANFVKSAQYPYYVAYHPSNTLSTLEVRGDGSTIPSFTQLDPNDMEYDSHVMISTAFGTPPSSLNLDETNAALDLIQMGAARANSEASTLAASVESKDKPADEQIPKPKEVTIAQNWIVEPSETLAWTVGSSMRLKSAADNGMPDVYRLYAIIAKPLVGDTDESDSIAKLAETLTYSSLAANLKASYDSLSPALYNLINRKMTVVVNRVLRQELGMGVGEAGSAMTNFMDDIDVLLEILEETYGPVLKNAFLANQQQRIRTALLTLPEEQRNDTTDSILDVPNEGEERVKVTYLCSQYSMTFLNTLAWELNIEMPDDGTPTQLTPELTPALFQLVQGIFEDAANYSGISRHLIRTRDGRIIEATKGALVDGSFLLAIVE